MLIAHVAVPQIIAPGSQTTLAQLGLPESFTPARFRFPTRMFMAEKKGEWEPYKVREKVVAVKHPGANGVVLNGDTQMKDGAETGEEKAKPENTPVKEGEGEEEQVIYEEDVTSDEGAVYPLQ